MSDLPENWTSANILELSRIIRGVTYSKNDAHDEPAKGLIPILRAMNITERGLDFDDLVYVPRKLVKDEQIIKAGDVIAAISSGSITVVGKAKQTQTDLDAAFGAFCAVLRPVPEVDHKYFGHFFGTQQYRFTVSSLARGVNINNLKREHFEQIEIPLAPLDEQKRIAEKLDSLLTRVDSCERHLERVPQILKRFRQSVLAAATSGRLTEEWRNERGISIEDWDTKTGKEIFPFITSGSRWWAKYYSDSGSIFIRVGNLDHDTIELDLRNIQYVTPPDDAESKRTRVQVGDILISITADVGMVGYVRKDIGDAYTNQHVCIARQTGEYNGEFLAYYLTSPVGGLGQLTKAQRGATKAGLTLGDIRELIIQIPSPEEQAEIVRRVESLFAYAERLEARTLSASERVARLTPSLLAKGFRGELVEQDPNDESAAELLERVKAGRDDVQPQKAGPRGKKGKK